ncbi:hypothetical protein K4L06_07415 [Lysobacter sp. BMK333-48F3]|uniref:hypothetical protein n=1 Tax=Lysobacter sp. BMK333-48F3 TaxID=2867962 RepID=UPI001C8C36C3|nr:hypothetical protein [Lysobacter sp. BMK333-48F3]MBX9401139.1 hypothetical protein [Lysobacter sp. BMK333-48F3]
MTRYTVPASVALALAFALPAQAADKIVDGYGVDRAALAAGLPVRSVAMNTTLRPQLGYAMTPSYSVSVTPWGPGVSPATTLGVGLATGLISGALINASIYEDAQHRAMAAFSPIRRAGCELQADTAMHAAIDAAVRRSPWGAGVRSLASSADERSLDSVVKQGEPRHVFAFTSSLSVEMAGLVTTVDVSAYAPQDGGSDWRKRPLWRDLLIVVSDPVSLEPKTQADIDSMVAEERARYAASGGEELIKRVNARGGSADPIDRKAALAEQRLHKKFMDTARQPVWTFEGSRFRRAQLWAENDCARLKSAIAQAGAETGRLLDDLYAQKLPPRLGQDERQPAMEEQFGVRKTVALPGGAYVSRADQGEIDLRFRYDLLPADK